MQILHSCVSEEGTVFYNSRNHNSKEFSIHIFSVHVVSISLIVFLYDHIQTKFSYQDIVAQT